MNDVLFSSKTEEWATPQQLFDKLNEEFNFNLDPCSTHENAKCKNHYTKAEDGLQQPWSGITFMNPPYGRDIGKWVKKALEESTRGGIVVCLLPARTDTKWFHDYVLGKAEIRFVKGRLKFGDSKNSAPFPSMIAIFDGTKNETEIQFTAVS